MTNHNFMNHQPESPSEGQVGTSNRRDVIRKIIVGSPAILLMTGRSVYAGGGNQNTPQEESEYTGYQH